MKKGLFIVFEGIDASGTTTQASLLHHAMISDGYKAKLTAEPTSGPIGHLIREIHTHRMFISHDKEIVSELIHHLFVADRRDHLYNEVDGILLNLNKGVTVISTRYFLSSLAYGSYTSEGFEKIAATYKDFPLPDITFYLSNLVTTSMRRIKMQGRSPDFNETEENLMRVSINYDTAIAQYKGRLEILDATSSIEMLADEIADYISTNELLKGIENGNTE